MRRSISVQELYQAKQHTLGLDLVTPGIALDRAVADPDVSGPGLALVGYLDRFPAERVQVFGQTEMEYLATLDPNEIEERLAALFRLGVPAVIVSKGQVIPDPFLRAASETGVPVFRAAATTGLVFRRLKPFLERALAPTTTLHGSLADVYGVGLLVLGASGIGKSECVLDLVERGHRLVADDLVIVSRRGADLLIGRGHERQKHHMEIRGVGIIDIRALFGVQAIRQQKRIELALQLEPWDDEATYDRTGLERESMEILEVEIPRVTLPLNPGKNASVVAEVAAMNHLLRYTGVDSSAEFDRNLRASMRPADEYLEEDYE